MMQEARIIHGDCLAPGVGLPTLADGSVDVTITDPPYDAHTHESVMRGARSGWGNKTAIARMNPVTFSAMTPKLARTVLIETGRITRRWVLIFSSAELAHVWMYGMPRAGIEYVRTGFWHKANGAPQFTGDRPAVGCEVIVIGHRMRDRGKLRWNGGGRQAFWDVPIAIDRGGTATEPRVHPTQKPLALMRQLVELFSDPGELVCDPFSGSGTTGVAAMQAGRRFVGWELDPEHAATAAARLRGDETRQRSGQMALL